jgi:hypothetical protein
MKMELGNFLGIHMCEREMRGGELHFLLQYNHGLSFNFFSFLPSSFSSLFVSFLFFASIERERGRDESGVSVKRERGRELVPLVGRLFFELTCGTKEGGERQLIHSHVASFGMEEQKNIGIGKHRNMIGMQMQKRRIKNKEILHV